ncbi:hypothetical protein MTO96_046676 [Rhipicephalus appendiculatus]
MDLITANAFVDAINNRNVQRFVRLARPTDVPSALAVALEAEIQERSQAAEDPYLRPTYKERALRGPKFSCSAPRAFSDASVLPLQRRWTFCS